MTRGNTLAAVGLTVGLALTAGCAETLSPPTTNGSGVEATSEASLPNDGIVITQAPDLTHNVLSDGMIDLGSQRVQNELAALPPDVQNTENSVVQPIFGYTVNQLAPDGHTEIGQVHTVTGSGFKVGPRTVITAGHLTNGDQKVPPPPMQCGGIIIRTQTPSGPISAVATKRVGTYRPEQPGTSIYTTSNTVPDEGVIQIMAEDHFTGLPTIPVPPQETPLPPGTVVDLLSWQPEPDANGDLMRDPSSPDMRLNTPSVIAGIVLGKVGSTSSRPDSYAILTDLKSYVGQRQYSVEGSSGGPVEAANGVAVGMSVATVRTAETAQTILDRFHIKLLGTAATITVTIMQAESANHVGNLENSLISSPPMC